MAFKKSNTSKKETNNESNLDLIGSIWKKKSKNGNDYLSGMLNGEKIVIFSNKNKKSDKSPDFFIFQDKGE